MATRMQPVTRKLYFTILRTDFDKGQKSVHRSAWTSRSSKEQQGSEYSSIKITVFDPLTIRLLPKETINQSLTTIVPLEIVLDVVCVAEALSPLSMQI